MSLEHELVNLITFSAEFRVVAEIDGPPRTRQETTYPNGRLDEIVDITKRLVWPPSAKMVMDRP